MNLGTIWWMNRQREKHERRAEDYERQARREPDPRRKARLELDAQIERGKARRMQTGIRL